MYVFQLVALFIQITYKSCKYFRSMSSLLFCQYWSYTINRVEKHWFKTNTLSVSKYLCICDFQYLKKNSREKCWYMAISLYPYVIR